MSVTKKPAQLATSATGANPTPEGEAVAPKGAKPKVEAVANVELVSLFEKYDLTIGQAESFFIELVEFIQSNQLDRATVIASMMRARKITFESAQSQYSRMKALLNNEEVLQELRDGKITLKVAREKTVKKQENPKSAKPEAKEKKFSDAMKAFVAAAKEGGYAIKEILLSVEAELKSAGIKLSNLV